MVLGFFHAGRFPKGVKLGRLKDDDKEEEDDKDEDEDEDEEDEVKEDEECSVEIG